MRSLAIKLTLGFIIMGLVGAVLVAFLVWQSTRTAFNQFINDREQQNIITSLQQYYQTNGSWEGISDNNLPFQPDPHPVPDGRHPFGRFMAIYTLVSLDRTIMLSDQLEKIGQIYPSGDLNSAITLQADGKTIGWLVHEPIPVDRLRNSPESLFMVRVERAVELSALIAVLLALFLGGALAFTLTRSLRELREAADDIAQGNLGRQVKIRSNDELGVILALSFNRMSSDLARATQARRQMTADIAHDLRTPLSVIAGYTEALSDGKLPGNPETYTILNQEIIYLERLIEDLRLLSLADAGELTLNLFRLAPRAFLEQVAARHAMSAAQSGITLDTKVGNDCQEITADHERLAQVLDNLLANALRHTPSGGKIILEAVSVGNTVELRVIDNGSGIPSEELSLIFDRFYRGDKSRKQNGESGLGLAIAKSLIEAQGGQISVHSQPGQGTTFLIIFPKRELASPLQANLD